MITPPYLKKGDKIGIISTARKITQEEIEPAISVFSSWGLEVILGRNLFEVDNQFAGTDEQRASDLQKMLDDPEIKAIICARGGYGTVRIIDRIDFSRFIENPKWIVGFSDVTVLLSHIYSNFGIESIHGIMPVNFPPDGFHNAALDTLKNALFGREISYTLDPHRLNRNGSCRGELVGGNLSILYNLTGSISDIDTAGKILFIEDLDEYLYHVDRMMMNLKRSGRLANLAGMIVGALTDMNDNEVPFGRTAYQIVADTVAEYNFPVIFGFPAGHIDDNRVLIIGREVVIEVGKKVSVVFGG